MSKTTSYDVRPAETDNNVTESTDSHSIVPLSRYRAVITTLPPPVWFRLMLRWKAVLFILTISMESWMTNGAVERRIRVSLCTYTDT